MRRLILAALIGGMIPGFAMADPRTLDVFTSFEPGDVGPTFGTSPISVTFDGGSSVFEAMAHLYHDASQSWKTDPGSSTTITFETPASIVEFFALDVGSADATITALDIDGVPLDLINLTNTFPGPMMEFDSPYAFFDLGPIGSLLVNNPGDGATYIDSFGFSAFEEEEPPPVGSSPDDPILPTSGGGGGTFVFSNVPSGRWFDPPIVDAFGFEIDGGANFTIVGLPPLDVVPDGDGQYTVRSEHGEQIVAAGGQFIFPSPVSSFVLTGIHPLLEDSDPLAFPTYLEFDQLTATFYMTPLPEPSSLTLAAIGLVAMGVCAGRKRRKSPPSRPV